MRTLTLVVGMAVAWGLGGGSARAEFVWWEGENPTATNFPKNTWLSAATFEAKRNEILSGGDWLTNAGKRTGEEAYARYTVKVQGGNYSLWARKFWKHGPFRWRFDDGAWQTCGRDVGLADSTEIRQFVCVNWVSLGEVKLAAGSHTFELRLLAGPGEEMTACFDCFVLTQEPFIPRGKFKPGEKSGLAEAGWWAFEPPADQFGKAELDLRGLNEKKAGESGFVKHAGDGFTLGNGKAVRFWAVDVGGDVVRMEKPVHTYIAKRLAKVGVNMVRIHSALFDASASDPAKVDMKYLDSLQHFVSALREEGIYAKLSFYFPLWFDVKPNYGIPGFETIENKKPFALLTFDARMQEIYKSWAKALLTTKSPYTGVAFGQDPGVAIVEVINEDSYLFWTFSEKNIPRSEMEKLEKLFGEWLKKRYGSIDGAVKAWGARGSWKTDAPNEGRMGLLDAWNFTGQGAGKAVSKERMSDQLRFLVENQKGFYEGMVKYFRQDLGAKNLISCSNWITADDVTLDGLERYTYTPGDVMDRHGYFGGAHKGPSAGWSVNVGDTFSDRAGVLEPGATPIHMNQVEGFPNIISEIGWPNPNRFKAEFPFLCATYGAMTGLDGIYFFAVGGTGWESAPKKFAAACPTIMGQFPALALAYRRGDVREGPVVVREALNVEELYAFKGSAVSAEQNLDELRKADIPPGGEAQGKRVGSVDPLAFYVGRVVRSFGKDASKAMVRDLTSFIDRKKNVVRSVTGELAWDWGRGVVTVNTPRTQGATGFLGKAGRIELGDVVIESANEFGTVVVTALDDKPIATSAKLLIQAMTEEKTYGWKVEGNTIKGLGGYPMNVRKIEATVTIKGLKGAKAVRVLDEQGYARGNGKSEEAGGGVKVTLPGDAIYTVVE